MDWVSVVSATDETCPRSVCRRESVVAGGGSLDWAVAVGNGLVGSAGWGWSGVGVGDVGGGGGWRE